MMCADFYYTTHTERKVMIKLKIRSVIISNMQFMQIMQFEFQILLVVI